MATEPPAPQLPLFYNQLEPLSSNRHGAFKSRPAENASFLASTHAVPVTIDEFVACQRFYPIVFSVGDNPVPLVLMGLNEGVNVFVDENGRLINDTYVPAYIRRYPFMLARTRPESQELSLCFDPSSGLVGEFEEGSALFQEGKPSETTSSVLKFCEEFELSAQRTTRFVNDLKETGLLIDGEVAIQSQGSDQPFVYRGFQMVAEDKFKDLRGDELRKMTQNGMLPLLFAHIFSLSLVREIFARQIRQGKGPALSGMAPAGTA